MEEKIWQSILDLKAWIATRKDTLNLIFLIEKDGKWSWQEKLSPDITPILVVSQHDISTEEFPNSAVLKRINIYSFEICSTGKWTSTDLQLYRDYLAYSLLLWEARRQERAITVSHFAQSLDGRIATATGDSKWIGSEANLIHAHRMRALCEGILIGSGTLKADKPSLTVRLVTGENPQRIVLGSSQNGDFESLKKSCPNVVWAIGKRNEKTENGIKYISLETESPGKTDCEGLLQWLYKKGIQTIYVEGGAQTTSCFLTEGMIDILQLHISPQLFGSGLSGIQLAEIDQVKESVQFTQFDFQRIGESVMFVGEPQKPARN